MPINRVTELWRRLKNKSSRHPPTAVAVPVRRLHSSQKSFTHVGSRLVTKLPRFAQRQAKESPAQAVARRRSIPRVTFPYPWHAHTGSNCQVHKALRSMTYRRVSGQLFDASIYRSSKQPQISPADASDSAAPQLSDARHISFNCLVAFPIGRSSGMPAQVRIVVSRSP